MLIQSDDNKYCDIDIIINSFFTKFKGILQEIPNILLIKLKNN
jgi:hypothetical protein